MLSLLKEINEIDASLFEMGGLNLTGFSMIDYRNLNTMATLSDILQINEPISQVPQISVWHRFINNQIYCYLELKFVLF